MRKHQRQLIRDAVRDRLLGHTAAEDRVRKTTVVPWKGSQLPAIGVFTLEESVDPASKSTAPRELTRTMQLAIEGVVFYAEKADDALDDLAVEIEREMNRDVYFGPLAVDSILTSTSLGVDPTGEKQVGYVRLVYDVTYRTNVPEAEDLELDDLATTDTKISLGGTQAPADQAEDKLEGLDEEP
jgi:hypothetical protein